MTHSIFLSNEQATLDFAQHFSGCLKGFRQPECGLNIYLNGDLGAGKTTFVRGLLHSLGFSGSVKSPTYTLLETYHLKPDIEIQHFDLYRFSYPQEWEEAGFDDCIATPAIRLIEWAEKGAEFAPPADIIITFTVQDMGRMVTINALTSIGKECLQLWQN